MDDVMPTHKQTQNLCDNLSTLIYAIIYKELETNSDVVNTLILSF